MDRLLYIAMTGATHNNRAQAVHANNLANVGTHGFKADMAQARAMPVFGDTLASRVFALAERPATDLAAGNLDETGRSLDLAIDREGWFVVQAEDGGNAMSRQGHLQVDPAGVLRNGVGQAMIGDGGPISLPPFEKIYFGEDGTITIQPQGQGPDVLVIANRLRLVNPDPADLEKSSDGLFRTKDGVLPRRDEGVRVSSGLLETSNVNAVEEMVNIMALSRQFELQVKMMQNAQENDRAATTLIRINN